MSFIIGILLLALGVGMVIKTEFLVQNFGSLPFFDKYMHTEGGTRLGYKLLGFVVIFFGILTITNMYGTFLAWVLNPLTKYIVPQGQ